MNTVMQIIPFLVLALIAGLIIKPHLRKIRLPERKSPVQVVPRLRVSQNTMDEDLKDLLRKGR